LRHPDWFAYRDPGSVWQRPYVKLQAEEERGIERAVTVARDIGALADINPEWHGVLATSYEGWACAEYGLFLALSRSVRPALSDTISMALLFGAVDRLRHQQDIALLALDLEAELVGYPAGTGVSTWMNNPVFQPTRAIVERLMVTEDWAETAFVVAYLFDPLVSNFITGRFLRRFAPAYGDILTPQVLLAAERARLRNMKAMEALVLMVLAESDGRGRPVPSEENRCVLQDWVDEWAPAMFDAITAFSPVFKMSGVAPDTAKAAAAYVGEECERILLGLGVDLPTAHRR
jgi:methane monooxygenase component A beta chain/propane monooxygenase small subunit